MWTTRSVIWAIGVYELMAKLGEKKMCICVCKCGLHAAPALFTMCSRSFNSRRRRRSTDIRPQAWVTSADGECASRIMSNSNWIILNPKLTQAIECSTALWAWRCAVFRGKPGPSPRHRDLNLLLQKDKMQINWCCTFTGYNQTHNNVSKIDLLTWMFFSQTNQMATRTLC